VLCCALSELHYVSCGSCILYENYNLKFCYKSNWHGLNRVLPSLDSVFCSSQLFLKKEMRVKFVECRDLGFFKIAVDSFTNQHKIQ